MGGGLSEPREDTGGVGDGDNTYRKMSSHKRLLLDPVEQLLFGQQIQSFLKTLFKGFIRCFQPQVCSPI